MMSIAEEIAVLQKFPMFASVEPKRLKLVAMASERVAFEPGEVVYQEGDVSDAVYVVLDGLFTVSVSSEDGPLVFAEGVRGALFGAAGVLWDADRDITITAQTPILALRLNQETFAALLEESRTFSLAVTRELGRQLVTLTKICAQLARQMPPGLPIDLGALRPPGRPENDRF